MIFPVKAVEIFVWLSLMLKTLEDLSYGKRTDVDES